MTRILTIGHSTRALDEFISLLREFKIETLVDIRRFPGSRRLPHFNRQELEQTLPAACHCEERSDEAISALATNPKTGIQYVWLEDLGGRRSGPKLEESENPGLTSPGFRHYADYMQTEQFRNAVERLMQIATANTAAIMCAEKLFWKCHRRLLSDYLVAHGVQVEHIVESNRLQPHKLSPDAEITHNGNIIYPAKQKEPKLFE